MSEPLLIAREERLLRLRLNRAAKRNVVGARLGRELLARSDRGATAVYRHPMTEPFVIMREEGLLRLRLNRPVESDVAGARCCSIRSAVAQPLAIEAL